jgi:hypothetical protein
MTDALTRILGTKDWKPGDDKVSSSRIIMYGAFALVAAALIWAGLRTSIWGQPYSELQTWVEDVVKGAKWFLAPYGGSIVRDALVGKQAVTQDNRSE